MDIQLSQIIFQIINFGVVLLLLNHFLYKPVLKMLAERKVKVKEAAKAAEEVLQEKNDLSLKSEKILSKAKKEAQGILTQAKTEAAEVKQQQAEASKAELSVKRSKAEAELKAIRQAALKDQEKEVKEAALLIAEKVLAKEIDAKKHADLLDRELEKIVESL